MNTVELQCRTEMRPSVHPVQKYGLEVQQTQGAQVTDPLFLHQLYSV